MNALPRLRLAWGLAAVVTVLAFVGVAVAKTQVVKDRKDSPGKLDVKQATAGQKGKKGRTIVHTVSLRFLGAFLAF